MSFACLDSEIGNDSSFWFGFLHRSKTQQPQTNISVDIFSKDSQMVGPPAEEKSCRLLEKLAKENMELRASLSAALHLLASSSTGEASAPVSSSFSGHSGGGAADALPGSPHNLRPAPKSAVQSGYYPSTNDNVARYKRQNVSVEERMRLDIRNEKKRRYRARTGRWKKSSLDTWYFEKPSLPVALNW